ncbi:MULTISPECIES: class I SAM-dependent methyltransferase [Carnobacterium]|uniref:class I SAM-dependent methyltransferase n=1 Tax=Carnobacterium TaxID=2747 RepID=UPI00288DE74E|nr:MULTISPECIES: class I SAM-dependent methyltransferase [Carnobacterium]MDT1939930.1 class I SAM-dependent methyltransferase [Carnobacterium divergens]MDT1942368.1 class I SAM-dependent methyltransferase [Carnobacterium divergens]MDT1948174.1 class I SAM-dependent methyltransferase [Carnobacterium divergens]MDT1950654.1 class I SAM-dependent methyltransferase [Carnobacterium divergens]MDT1955934.1 class I SAM-dependent methyltransferase [Carnobacterium divergens]
MGNIQVFEKIAPNYENDERRKIAKIIADAIRQQNPQGNQQTAIDYDCGTGLVGMELLSDFKSIQFVDASKNMVEIVEQKINNQQVSNATTLCLDIELNPSVKLHGDCIFLVQVLLHVPTIESLLSNLYQSLNRNGQLLIIDFDYNEAVVSDNVHSGFKQQELIQTMKKIGFTDVKSTTFYHGSQLFMNQDASLFMLEATKN